MDVLTTINSLYPSLTKSEQKIAQYVLVNSGEVEHFTVSELAQETEVAETTVIRFARKLNFKGYQDFKMQLTRDLASDRVRTEGDSNELTENYSNYLTRYSNSIDPATIMKAAKKIDAAHSVCIFGAGISSIIGTYFKSRLTRLGIPVIFDPDIHLQAIDIALLQSEDVVVAISASGNTHDLLSNVNIVKNLKIPIISLSNYLNSKLSEISDINVLSLSGKGSDSSEFLPVLGQLLTIDLICQQLAKINPERTQTLKNRINETLINKI